MARSELVLQVFIASPAELSEERAILVQIIDELNSLWARNLGIRLEPIRWETHAYPAFGEDAQAVVNQQLPQDFDLFVGLMWTRFGSSTGRAGSGTAEEFEKALARLKKDPNAVQIMIYFKDAPKAPSEIDPEQLVAVNGFRQRVENEGGLHWRFTSADDFGINVRIHLTRFVQDWHQRNPPSKKAETGANAIEIGLESQAVRADEEVGFLDLVETAMENLKAVTQTFERLTSFTQELNDSVQQRSAEMTALTASGLDGSPAAFKRITNRLAEDMEQYVRRTRVEITEFERQLDDAMAATGTVASLALDFGDGSPPVDALPILADRVDDFGRIMGENATSTRALRETVVTSPRLTTTYNRAKRATGEVLEEVARILCNSSDTCKRVAVGIRDIARGHSSGDNEATT